MTSPLEGILVLCFAELYPGPYATALLADMGAEVVLVERTTGDRARPIPDFFAAFARGKRSVPPRQSNTRRPITAISTSTLESDTKAAPKLTQTANRHTATKENLFQALAKAGSEAEAEVECIA